MITIKISDKEVRQAKRLMKLFDEQKTYNKFTCDTNYRGLLGEMVLDRYLTANNVKHEWVDFCKPSWHEADFIIDGKSIDLKTSVTSGMWFNKVEHDIYVYAQIAPDDSVLYVKSWLTLPELKAAKTDGSAVGKNTHGRDVYVINDHSMLPIEMLSLMYSNPVVN